MNYHQKICNPSATVHSKILFAYRAKRFRFQFGECQQDLYFFLRLQIIGK